MRRRSTIGQVIALPAALARVLAAVTEAPEALT
jgi:hypothetical protein